MSCCGGPCHKTGQNYIGQMPADFSFTDFQATYERQEDGPGLDHPLVKLWEPIWRLMRDSSLGEEAIKAGGTQYLTKRSGMRNDEYGHYKSEAIYPEAVSRTREAILSKAFNKPSVPEGGLDFDNLDSEGLSFFDLERWCLSQVMDVARGGLLVDVDENGQQKIVRYTAENIRNWKHNKNGELSLLVLREFCDDNETSFRHELIERRRVLTLQSGVYAVQVYELQKNKEDQKNKASSWVLVTEGDFTIPATGTGDPLQGIPFFFLCGADPSKSILEPLAKVALRYYAQTARLDNILYEGCYPQKVLICEEEDNSGAYTDGVDFFGDQVGPEDAVSVELGTSQLLILRQARLEIVESGGQSIGKVFEWLDRLEAMMVAYGARIFDVKRTSNTAAQTESMQQSADTSLINAMARHVQTALGAALNVAAEWAGQEAPQYKLHVDAHFGAFELKDIMNIMAGVGTLYATSDAREILRDAGKLKRTDAEIDEDIEREGFEQFDLTG